MTNITCWCGSNTIAGDVSWKVGEKVPMDWVMMERWVIILLKRQFSGKTVSRITGSPDQGSRITGSRITGSRITESRIEDLC